MKRVLNEPLLHFLLLGGAIFGLFSLVSPSDPPQAIVVTQGKIESFVGTFARTWQRPPTRAELDGLIRDYVREEVYCREAKALGLDRDDSVIRRRLRQKFEFVSEDVGATQDPTDEDLRAFLAAHAERFAVESRVSFRQVYLNVSARRDTVAADAARLLSELNERGGDPAAIGDATLLERDFESVPLREVAKQFGAEFAAKLGELPTGRWQGPIDSAYGAHLVFVRGRAQTRVPALDEVRDAVRRDWTSERRREADEKLYQSLLARYAVRIEPPKSPEEPVRRVAAR